MFSILLIKSQDGKLISLNYKQWKHIAYRHPEMSRRLYNIEETIRNPDYIKTSEEKIKYYKYLKEEKKYVMVAVKVIEYEGFVLTSYLTSKIEK